jgi:predicted transcriptional regulator
VPSAITTKHAPITVRVEQPLRERLEQIARQTESRLDDLIVSVLTTYVEHYDWETELIRKRLAEEDAGGPFIAHEDIVRWVRSWGTEDELPPPEATIFREPQK